MQKLILHFNLQKI